MTRALPGRRAGATALFLVAALVALAAIGLAATARFRSQATRQIAHVGAALEQISLASQALGEVSSQQAVNLLMQAPGNAAVIQEAVRAGVHEVGVVTPAPHALVAQPGLTASEAAAGGFTVSPVEVRLMELYPGISRGRLRFSVRVGSTRDGGPGERVYAHEFAVHAYEPGDPDGLAFEITENPEWRLYP